MLSQSTNSRKKSRWGVVVGSWRRRGPTLLGSPSLAPTLLLHKPGARIPVLGSLCLAGGWAGQRAAALSPPPADSVWPARGVFVCVCSSTSLALTAAQSLSDKRSIKPAS